MILRLLPLAFVLLGIALGRPAPAADPECIPGDPAQLTPFDPASGPYVRPNRDAKFCTSTLPNPASQIDMVCRVTVDGAPYAQVTRKQQELVVVSNPDVPGGTMDATCEIPGVDNQGNPIVLVSAPATVDYLPVPVPEAPVPLE